MSKTHEWKFAIFVQRFFKTSCASVFVLPMECKEGQVDVFCTAPVNKNVSFKHEGTVSSLIQTVSQCFGVSKEDIKLFVGKHRIREADEVECYMKYWEVALDKFTITFKKTAIVTYEEKTINVRLSRKNFDTLKSFVMGQFNLNIKHYNVLWRNISSDYIYYDLLPWTSWMTVEMKPSMIDVIVHIQALDGTMKECEKQVLDNMSTVDELCKEVANKFNIGYASEHLNIYHNANLLVPRYAPIGHLNVKFGNILTFMWGHVIEPKLSDNWTILSIKNATGARIYMQPYPRDIPYSLYWAKKVDYTIILSKTDGTHFLENKTLDEQGIGNFASLIAIKKPTKNGEHVPFHICVTTLTGKKIIIPDVSCIDSVKKLKESIFDKSGVPMDQQRLIHAGKQLVDDSSLCDYNIKAGDIIHMILSLRGGGGENIFSFLDVSNENEMKTVGFAHDGPDYRQVVSGVSIVAKCMNELCVAYCDTVACMVKKEYFDMDFEDYLCECPVCNESVTPITIGFNNCWWRFSGIKAVYDAEMKEIVKSKWKFADNNFHYFDQAEAGTVDWKRLMFQVIPISNNMYDFYTSDKEPDKTYCQICLKRSGRNVTVERPCGHNFHDSCFKDDFCCFCQPATSADSLTKIRLE